MRRFALPALGALACAVALTTCTRRDVTGNPIIVTIGGINPVSGPTAGGTVITITGTNFPAASEIASVLFDTVPAASFSVTSPTEATVTTPPHTAGTVPVTVHMVSGDSAVLPNAFTFTGPLSITGVSPDSGHISGGTAIAISGSGFLNGATVAVGGTSATSVSVPNSGLITATTPAGTPGPKSVLVQNPDGQNATAVGAFTYEGPPTIASVSPSSGPVAGGTAITIAGTAFQAGAVVAVGLFGATGVTVTPTQITATAPAGTAGVKDVLVQNPDGQSDTALGAYTYVAVPPPAITSVSPPSGPVSGGTPITIVGTAFQSGATVAVGGAAATGLVVTATQITASTPAGTAGAKNVTVLNPDAQSSTATGAFTYVPAPVISLVSPSSGPLAGGTPITITGSAFQAGATVSVGGAAATGPVVTATQITATTPAGTAGAKNVVVLNPDGQSATVVGGFIYGSTPAPVLTSLSRDAGSTAGGAKMFLTGSNFVNGATVSFGGTSASVTFVSATSLQVTVPAHAVGAASVTVSQAGLTSTLSNAFLYLPSATVTYATQPDDGTFGTLHPTPGTFMPVISTDTALPGQTYSVKQAAAANDANNHSVGFVFQPSNAAPANLGNPEAADPNGLYARWYTYFPQATVNAMNTAQGTGQGQIKVHLARSYNGVGQPWFETGIGPEFNTGFGTGVETESDFDTGVFYQHVTGFVIPAGQWVEWQVSYRRDTVAHIGYAKLWINGKLVGQSQHANYGSDNLTDQSSISCGLVYVQHVANPVVVYVAGIQLANGYIEPR